MSFLIKHIWVGENSNKIAEQDKNETKKNSYKKNVKVGGYGLISSLETL